MDNIAVNMPIKVYGAKCLRAKSSRIEAVGASEYMLIRSMLETMYQGHGIGLAAPQVGINKQLFVVDVGEGPVVVVNPRILHKKGSAGMEEGCLSLPEVTVDVQRPSEIAVRYLDENNTEVERTFVDLMARVFQHESDHLFGKLIMDYAGWRQRSKIKKKLSGLNSNES